MSDCEELEGVTYMGDDEVGFRRDYVLNLC